jgi:hypothetical protein
MFLPLLINDFAFSISYVSHCLFDLLIYFIPLQFIKELKPHYQEVIQLRYFQEMSYQEISEQLNEPLSNVKIKLLRAKKLLAEIIESTR